jgi:uncharacterized protein
VTAVVDLVGFADRLRADGFPVDTGRVMNAMRALAAYRPLGEADIYWATRLTLCSRRADVPAFDAAFVAWFATSPPASDRHAAQTTTTAAAPDETVSDDDAEPAATYTRAGRTEWLDTPTWLLSVLGLIEVHSYAAALAVNLPQRLTMRQRSGGRRSIDLARTAGAMARTAGEPLRLFRQRRVYTRRRLTLLLDVSESMREHRDRLLRFAFAAVTVAPRSVEVFTLGTRLDRITVELQSPHPHRVAAALAAKHRDWDGGTRLGETIATFVRVWGGHRAVRSADLVLMSDGWELADPAPFVVQIARLHRLARRLIWADPDAGEPRYTPEAPALRASLPYVSLVPGHDPAALRALASQLGTRR